jgi:glucose/arabinose dehydrogenase
MACDRAQGRRDNVTIAEGYVLEPVLAGLDAPTAAVFDGEDLLVAESGRTGASGPRVLRRRGREDTETIAEGGLRPPVAGLAVDGGTLFVSHAGAVAAFEHGTARSVLEGLPSEGDHGNTQLARGPDGRLYLGQGTRTNAGVVGPDNFVDGWLLEHPRLHEIPCEDVVLNGQSFASENPFDRDGGRAVTGAYRPFGHRATPGETVPGRPRCGGSIARFAPDGTGLEVVAWGLRNPTGLRFDRAGRLWAVSQGPEDRGSRAISNAPDVLVRVQGGAWYGWPDYVDGEPVSGRRFQDPDRARPQLLWQHHPPLTRPFASVPGGSGIAGFDFSPGAPFGHGGDAFAAASGGILRIDMKTGEAEDFARAARGSGALQQPVDALFGPDGALYVVDIGILRATARRPQAVPGTGTVWRIHRVGR